MQKLIMLCCAIVVINLSCTKLPDFKNEIDNSFILYPNPCVDIINIDLQPGYKTLKIYNVTGKEIGNFNSANLVNITVDLKNEKDGKFIAILETEKGTITKSFYKFKP